MHHVFGVVIAFCLLGSAGFCEWRRHTIDDSSRGADGVRVADVNHDGQPDLVTGWEEGGEIRVYTNPGPTKVKQTWPALTVGKVRSPEDAFFADLDGDRHLDVISSCEGKTRTVYVHWGPREGGDWETQSIPALQGKAMWMFAAPMEIDGKNGVDVICAAKGEGAEIGWLESPPDARDMQSWKWHPLAKVGWVMSIVTIDMDGDRDLDILYSDRKSATRGVHWLEYDANAKLTDQWERHTVGGADREVMFLAVGDVDGDGRNDIATTVRGGDIIWFQRGDAQTEAWAMHEVSMPENTGTGKGIAVADVNLDGRNDLVYTCENAEKKIGVGWLSAPRDYTDSNWTAHDISGDQHGTKFDLIQMLDLDADGDLDVVTCEERNNLGVIWYENPAR